VKAATPLWLHLAASVADATDSTAASIVLTGDLTFQVSNQQWCGSHGD